MKTAKYVSKNQNLRLVLKPGIPSEPIIGRQAVAGVYVKFEQGLLDINENTASRMGYEFDELIKLVERHPSFNAGFARLTDEESDPYKNMRKSIEPEHDMVEIKYGSIGRNINPKPAVNLTVDQQIALKKMAEEMAKKMAPAIAIEILKGMAKEAKSDKKVGRPANVKKEKEVKVQEENTRGASNPEESVPMENNTEEKK